jgi:hypothetical protein
MTASFINATSIRWSFLANPLVRFVLTCLFEAPLAELWLNGPAFGNWGFHEGREFAEICAYYSTVPASHWRLAAAECEALVNRKLNAFLLSFDLILYALFLVGLLMVCFAYFILWLYSRIKQQQLRTPDYHHHRRRSSFATIKEKSSSSG